MIKLIGNTIGHIIGLAMYSRTFQLGTIIGYAIGITIVMTVKGF